MAIIPLQQEIVLKEGRFVRRTITSQDLGSQDQVIANLADAVPLWVPKVSEFNELPVGLMCSRNNTIVIAEIKDLPFNCAWRLRENGILTPVFPGNSGFGNPAHIRQKFSWKFADQIPGAKGLLALNFNNGPSGQYNLRNVYMFMHWQSQLWVLPYPNIFEDGRVCMGAAWDQSQSREASPPDLFTKLSQVYNSFYATGQNTDLLRTGYETLFARDLSSWTTPADPRSCLSIASVAFMQSYKP